MLKFSADGASPSIKHYATSMLPPGRSCWRSACPDGLCANADLLMCCELDQLVMLSAAAPEVSLCCLSLK